MGGKLEDVSLLAKTPEAAGESLAISAQKGPWRRGSVILRTDLAEIWGWEDVSQKFLHAGWLIKEKKVSCRKSFKDSVKRELELANLTAEVRKGHDKEVEKKRNNL